MANITRRGSSYLIKVSCGYDADGKQIIKSKTWRIPKGMSDKRAEAEAQKAAVIFEEECHNGEVSSNPRLKFKDFIPTYLEMIKPHLSVTTYYYYVKALDNYIIPYMGNWVMKDIKPYNIQQFITYLSNKPSEMHRRKDGTCPGEVKPISPATVMRYLTVVRSVFRIAYKQDIVTKNPTDARRLEMPVVPQTKVEIFSKQETAELLMPLNKEPLQIKVYILLSIITGARRGELAALKFSDFNRETNILTIERSAYKVTGMPTATKPTKENKCVSIGLNNFIFELIDRLREEKEQLREQLGNRWAGDEWLFTQWDGSLMNPHTMTRTFSKFLKKNGLRHRKLHALRHSTATLMLAAGYSIKEVQQRLGHGDIKTTSRYLHVIEEANTAATDTLTEILLGVDKKSEST